MLAAKWVSRMFPCVPLVLYRQSSIWSKAKTKNDAATSRHVQRLNPDLVSFESSQLYRPFPNAILQRFSGLSNLIASLSNASGSNDPPAQVSVLS